MDLCPFMDWRLSDKHSDKHLNVMRMKQFFLKEKYLFMIHKGLQYDKNQISSKGKYINLQSMIRKIFGPIKHSGHMGLILFSYLPSHKNKPRFNRDKVCKLISN